MNTKQLITTSFLFVIVNGAFAAEPTEFSIPASTLSRAQVLAELAQAQASGQYVYGSEADQSHFTLVASTLSRNDVLAEMAGAKARGDWAHALDSEQHPFALAIAPRSAKAVRGEARAFARQHEFDSNTVGG